MPAGVSDSLNVSTVLHVGKCWLLLRCVLIFVPIFGVPPGSVIKLDPMTLVVSLADAGMAFPADLAGVVTIGAASLADAGVASPADLAGVVTVDLASLADARVTSLADAGMGFPANLAGVITVGVLTWRMLGRHPWLMLGRRP